jgi:hypothetical protein
MAQDAERANGMRGWVKLVFWLSLALNFLVLGAVGGAVLRHGPWDDRHHPPRADMIGGPITRALSGDDKRVVARKMRRAYRETGQAGRSAYREIMQGLVADLRAMPFDPAPAAAHMDRMRGMMGQRMAVGQEALLEHLTEMDPEARRAFATRLEMVMTRPWKGRH